ncbi:retrovirus-related pol polyprotein from transposon TNT 1-94 [Tanacetum coccineum]
MNEKPGHVRPKNGFYEKLNALMFVPQKDLSGDQAYWLSANEIASQASKSATPATPFVRKSRPPSQVLTSLRNVNAVFPQFEGIIKERTTQRPDYVSEWCFDYAKQFVEQQLVPFYDHFKKHIQAANDTFFKEIKEFEQIFDELEAEYEQCVLDNKNLTIEKKNLLIINECLIAECLEKDICSIEHTKVLELEAEISKQKQLISESEKLKTTASGKDDTIRNLDAQIKHHEGYVESRWDLSAFTAENTKLKAQVTGTTSSGPSTSETPKVLAPGMYNLGSKYIPPPKRANWVKPTPVPKKKHTKRFKRQPKKEWKPIKRVWKQISKPVANSKPQWKPTGRHFSLFEKYPLTRIMEPTDMPLELPPSASSSPQITMVSRFIDHKLSDRKAGSTIVIWYLDSWMLRHMTGDLRSIGYGDYKMGDTSHLSSYYVEGLKHNLFSVGQFCDGGLEVAFRQHSCHIRNYDMVDLLNGSRTTNLYSISLNDMMSASPVCLLTKSILPQSHGKSTERITSTKDGKHNMKFSEYYTYMWTCGPLRTESINGKKYVLVIVDDYTRFGWVRFLRTKDETPQVIEKFIVKTQRALNATVRFVRTDNGTEAEAVDTCVVYTLNRSLVHTLHGKTYYELLKGKKPNLQYFRVFGSLCYPTNDYDDGWKRSVAFDELTKDCRRSNQFSGSTLQKDFCAKQYRTRNFCFTVRTRAVLHYLKDPRTTKCPFLQRNRASHSNSVNIDVTPTTITYVPKMDSSTFRLKTIIGDKDRPVLTRETARKPSDVEEIHEFERLDVWILVPCPDNILIIPLKWIFKIKLDEYGDVIVENKARLVGGYRQEVVLILKKSFAPVARLEAIRDSSIDSRSEYETWSTSSRWT